MLLGCDSSETSILAETSIRSSEEVSTSPVTWTWTSSSGDPIFSSGSGSTTSMFSKTSILVSGLS
jgi:hypothetical protein